MKTVIIGAGAGGQAVLEMFHQGRLAVLDLDILAVIDREPEAPGMRFARERGWPALVSVHEAMALPELELVIELTGDEDLLDDIYFLCPPGVRVMDHVLARVFWDLEEVHRNLEEELRIKTELEARVEEDRERLQQILNAVHAAITIKDLEGRYLLANPRAEHLIGASERELVGRTAFEVFGAEVGESIASLDRPILEGGGHQVTEEVRLLGGRERTLISERFGLHDHRGDRVAICCVSREVTRERELQRELLQTERLAAVGTLAAGVAHELNNPLTGIVTFAEELLLDAPEGDPRREDYEVILNEAMRCRGIVRDLLDYSRQRQPRPQRLELGATIRRTVNMVERQASFHNVDISVGDLEPLPRVNVDPQQIQQAILNLLINARDAMAGRGRIDIQGAVAADGREVTLSVTDTGPGVPESLRAKIFEPFFSTKGEHGNGLGLPAVASVMEQHGGRVELDEGPGPGAVFRLVFPNPDDGEKR